MPLHLAAGVALVVTALIGITTALDRGRRRRRLAELRRSWGAPTAIPRNMADVARYHAALPAPAEGDARRRCEVDDRTWSDLDMDRVFGEVDRTTSAIGGQTLYHRLRTPALESAPLERFDRLATAVGERPELRDELYTALAPLDVPNAYSLPDLFLRPLPPRPAAAALFPLLAVASLASLLVGIFVWPRALLLFLGVNVANVVLRSTLGGSVRSIAHPFRLLDRLVRVARGLGQSRAPAFAEHAAPLREATGRLERLARATGWIAWESPDAEDLRRILYDYLNNAFLLDLNALTFSLREIERRRADIRTVFETVGELDAAVSVASFRAGRAAAEGGGWARPSFADESAPMVMRDLVHPLVPDPVPNDLDARSRGVLITGSNMSGKTTYLRASGINAVLAQTIYSCTAREYRAPFVVVRSSIAHLDSVLAGRSYYMAEVESVLRLVHAASDDRRPHLFLLDELFRGTNAVERIAGAKAVLEHLARAPHTVLAATHDFELLDMLAHCYAPFHFRETVGPDGLSFDYALREGAATTRNAIALLEVTGAPATVVAEALRIAEQLDEQRRRV